MECALGTMHGCDLHPKAFTPNTSLVHESASGASVPCQPLRFGTGNFRLCTLLLPRDHFLLFKRAALQNLFFYRSMVECSESVRVTTSTATTRVRQVVHISICVAMGRTLETEPRLTVPHLLAIAILPRSSTSAHTQPGSAQLFHHIPLSRPPFNFFLLPFSPWHPGSKLHERGPSSPLLAETADSPCFFFPPPPPLSTAG